MNPLEKKLSILNPGLFDNYQKIKVTISKLLQMYSKNFPTYTDHSIEHTEQVLELASQLLNQKEIDFLNEDEIYILCTACILHDVGMCIPEDKISIIGNTEDLINYRKVNPDLSLETYIRNIHHILSYKFIEEEWQTLGIPSEKYARAIALVAQGHRKVDIGDFEIYDPQFFVKQGRTFVCLPYLSSIIRIADELDVTNLRTPEILCKYYMPDNERSQLEWNKHKATILVNFIGDSIRIEAKCTDHNMLAALEEQFAKIEQVITNCQKIIRNLAFLGDRKFTLEATRLEPKYQYVNFDPKGIKYSFDVKNVINAFVGKDLYNDDNAAIREAIQNAIDACNYKKLLLKDSFDPKIEVTITDREIVIDDNGQGMDDFIIENYFGRLASSYYDREDVKNEFQAIGQFGIGVFSYFLISDYIDIETKRKDKNSFKFRTDQDPNGYFHFFDGFKREQEGTRLTLNLKKEFYGKFPIDYIEKFIKKNFPYTGLTIFLNQDENIVQVEPDDFNLTFDKSVLPKMFFGAHEFRIRLNLLVIEISHNDFEGSMGLIVPVDKNFTDITLNQYFDESSFGSRNHANYSEIQIAQKGVFINSYASRLEFTVGKVNIKNKLNINLNRSAFRNQEDVLNIIDSFDAKVITKLYNEYLPSIGIRDKKGFSKFTKWFIDNNWSYSYKEKNEIRYNAVKENFYFDCYLNGNIHYLTLHEIDTKFDNIYIVNELTDKKLLTTLDNYIIIPLKKTWSYYSFFTNLLRYGQCTEIQTSGQYITVMRKSNFEELEAINEIFNNIFRYYSSNMTVFNNSKFALNLLDYLNVSSAVFQRVRYSYIEINSNHPFILMIVENIDKIKLNSSQRKLIEEILNETSDYLSTIITKRVDKQDFIHKLNLLVAKLSFKPDIKVQMFTIDDF